MYSLHSSGGCTLSTSNLRVTAKVLNTQCASGNGHNAGCNFVDANSTSYGRGFNMIGGGVFAHLWDDSGIKIWHFARNAIPSDINAQQPDPSCWGTPAAFWSSASCDISTHFQDHSLVLDITLCGDLGNPTFPSSGCNGTCASAVADPTNFQCEDFLFYTYCTPDHLKQLPRRQMGNELYRRLSVALWRVTGVAVRRE